MTAKKATQNEEKPVQALQTDDPVEKLVHWYEVNKKMIIAAATAVVVIAAGTWFVINAKSRKEAFGQRALQGARVSVQAGNLPLAESDLARVVDSYQGTAAGGDAAILLGHVRLLQNEDALAVTGLRDFVNSRPDEIFLEPANSLLAAALEEVNQMAEASAAYQAAADAAPFDFRKAELLNNAARTLGLSGDWPGALAIYRRVADEFPEAPAAVEALVRIGELGFVEQN